MEREKGEEGMGVWRECEGLVSIVPTRIPTIPSSLFHPCTIPRSSPSPVALLACPLPPAESSPT